MPAQVHAEIFIAVESLRAGDDDKAGGDQAEHEPIQDNQIYQPEREKDQECMRKKSDKPG